MVKQAFSMLLCSTMVVRAATPAPKKPNKKLDMLARRVACREEYAPWSYDVNEYYKKDNALWRAAERKLIHSSNHHVHASGFLIDAQKYANAPTHYDECQKVAYSVVTDHSQPLFYDYKQVRIALEKAQAEQPPRPSLGKRICAFFMRKQK